MRGSAHARKVRILLAAVVSAGTAGGCSRAQFRDRADKDVAGVITQKNIFPDWKVENWHVYPDPKARYADPSCPDKPPYPPDDYAAWLLSPNPQKPSKAAGSSRFEGQEYLKQIQEWDSANRAADAAEAAAKPADAAAKPADPAAKSADPALSYLGAMKSDETPYKLTIEQSVELAVFNSREFQDRREDLYLAALPVTQERFSFAAQAFAGGNVLRETTGRDLGGANRWQIGTQAGVSRFFPTGGQLLLRFANELTLDLTSSRPDVSLSNFSLTFLQPFLRGGGFAVTLENLTQAERTLLYAMRSYARFRKTFYVTLAGQGDYTNNPYGLQGLSANLGRGIGNNLTAPRAGFLPTLLRSATLANERKNIAALEQNLKLYQNLKEGGGVNELQVVRVEQQLLRSRATYLTNSRLYLDLLDNYKLQLGVPTTLPVELDDAPLRPQRKQLQRFEAVYAELRDFQDTATKYDAAETPDQLRKRWERLLTASPLARGTPLAKTYPAEIAALAKLSPDELAKVVTLGLSARQTFFDKRAERQLAGVEDSPAQVVELEKLEAAVDLARFEQSLRTYDARPWQRLPADKRAAEQAAAFRAATDSGLLVAIRGRNQRLDQIRAEWPDLPAIRVEGSDVVAVPLDEAATTVSRAALVGRLDLMNARAQVVDAYRQIAVRANALQGQLDVQYNLNTNSPAGENEAFNLGGSRTRNTVNLRFDPPIVRRAERNQYRAALIAYQRQRRTLMAFEDNILTDTRSDLRQVRAQAETYKLQQRAVELAYAQVDNARSTLLAPPDPTARDSAGNVAALTQQLLEAQNTLLQAQNDLYTGWMNYLTARMELSLDLETLPLDARGVWTDEPLPTDRTRPPVPPQGP